LPEADPAQAETAKVSALASAPPAPVIPPRFELGCLSALFHHRFSCHCRLSLTRNFLIKKMTALILSVEKEFTLYLIKQYRAIS
jgi:hypothetical protein